MTAQDIIKSAQLTRVRELQTALTKAAAENAALHDELDALKAHFDLALLAAMDLKGGEPLEIWDGWNLILGAKKEAKDRVDLIAQAKATGSATATLRALVDVAPTLLSLCDIPYDKAEYDGVNLMDEHHDVVYSQYSSGPSATDT